MDTRFATERVEMADYVRPIWRRLWIIIPVVAVVAFGVYRYYANDPPRYEASTQLLIQASDSRDPLIGGGAATAGASTDAANLLALLQTRAVAREAAKRLRYAGPPEVLLGQLTAQGRRDSDLIVLTGHAREPRFAAAVANAFARSFIALRSREQRANARAAARVARNQLQDIPATEQNADRRRAILDRIQVLEAIQALPLGSLRQLDPARADLAVDVRPDATRNAVFAAAIALILAVAAAYFLDRFDRRVRRTEDVEPLYELPTLAEMPRVWRPAPVKNGEVTVPDMMREPLRGLVTALALGARDRRLKTILVTSAVPREGKSTIARNLAITYRQMGLGVALVDTDLRKPQLDGMLPVARAPGLSSVLTGASWLGEVFQDVEVNVADMHALAAMRNPGVNGSGDGQCFGELAVLTSGPPFANPQALLTSDRLREVLAEIKAYFDVVIIDSPPILTVSDALPVLTAVDGTLLVSRLKTTTSDAAHRTMERLSRLPNVNVLGVVVNAVPTRDFKRRTYGGYTS